MPYYIKPGEYRHFKGNIYEVIEIAKHSETLEEMVVYRAFYGERGLWVRPASMWDEIVEYNGEKVKRFTPIKSRKMKVIISRKGFDSGFGGCPSPILPDGTMLSMPIPIEKENNALLFTEIEYKNRTYSEYLKQLNPKKNYEFCHLDPDIRANVRKTPISNWQPAFGQCEAAQSHLKNCGVTVGDLFLFFGYYRKTEDDGSGNLKYIRTAPEIQALYGYLQIGDIIKDDDVKKYPWHPHCDSCYFKPNGNNTLYLASEKLLINGEDTDLPGYGVFRYSDDVVLTKDGLSRSRWKLLDWMKDAKISRHFPKDIKEDYFQSVSIGQEFVIQENDAVTEWAKRIILNNTVNNQ